MTANGFRGLEVRIDSLERRVNSMDTKFEQKFDLLSQRIDDLSSGKVSRQEYLVLAGRISDIEAGA